MCLFLHDCYDTLAWGENMKNSIFGMIIKVTIVCCLIWYIPNKQMTSTVIIEANTKVSVPSSTHSIYLYNTHQSETYVDYDVVEAAYFLQDEFINDGYYCDMLYEDLDGYRKEYGIDYSECYTVSKMFIEGDLTGAKKYDLIVDIHRDALSHDLSTIEYEGISYAKMMFVVGKGSENYESVNILSNALSDVANSIVPGISRGVYLKDSHYNQGISDNMVLLELGANENTKAEVLQSIAIFKEVIERYLNGL